MNIKAHNLDSLRNLVRTLQTENKRLKELLEQSNIPYEPSNIFDTKIENTQEYDLDQGGRILDKYITRDLANQFFPCFGAEPMCMPKEAQRVDIFLSATTGGMTGSVRNSGGRG